MVAEFHRKVPVLPSQPPQGADTEASPRGWLIVAALFLMLSIIITARNSMGLMPFWKDDLGWSYKFVSTASATMLITMAVIAPIVGSVIDRLGSRMIYATGMTVIGVVFILCSFMTQPWQLIALFSSLAKPLRRFLIVSSVICVHAFIVIIFSRERPLRRGRKRLIRLGIYFIIIKVISSIF